MTRATLKSRYQRLVLWATELSISLEANNRQENRMGQRHRRATGTWHAGRRARHDRHDLVRADGNVDLGARAQPCSWPGRRQCITRKNPGSFVDVKQLNGPMHWAHGIAMGAVRGALDGAGLRGPFASVVHSVCCGVVTQHFIVDSISLTCRGAGQAMNWPPTYFTRRFMPA